jgi:hypothetical protein
MTEYEIIITPAGGRRQADIFAAHWGKILLATSHTPFFDSARKLLELGAEPNDLLIMRHRRSSTTSLCPRVNAAAQLAVHEANAGPRYVQWRDLGEIWRTGSEVDC